MLAVWWEASVDNNNKQRCELFSQLSQQLQQHRAKEKGKAI
jgi:hypothetical protein